jgi:hypothetical protein
MAWAFAARQSEWQPAGACYPVPQPTAQPRSLGKKQPFLIIHHSSRRTIRKIGAKAA